MTMSINNVSLNNVQCRQPSFGSVALSRVVLRQVQPNGDIFYKTLPNDDSLNGVYQSLALRVNQMKDKALFAKLKATFTDIRKSDYTKIASTNVGNRSETKRFIMTGPDARSVRDIGTDLAGAMDDKQNYANAVRNNILSNYKRRVINQNGEEVALDLIVEENSKGKKKLVDVEISTLSQISKDRPPVIKQQEQVNKSSSTPSSSQVPSEQKKPVQGTFDFLNDVKNPDTPPGIYD